MELFVVAWVLAAAIFGPWAAMKAKRLGQPFWPWLVAGIALPVVTLAVVSYFEPDRRKS